MHDSHDDPQSSLRAAASRNAWRVALSDALRISSGVEVLQSQATRLLGAHLGVSRAFYAQVSSAGMAHIGVDYAEGVPSMVGEHDLHHFGQLVVDQLGAGRTVIHTDVRAVAELPQAAQAAYASAQIVAQLKVPLLQDGRLAAFFGVHQNEPRSWDPADVALVEETAERIWAALERDRADEEVRAGKQRLQLALAAARMGTWLWDIANDVHLRDENLNRLLGLEPVETTQPFTEFLSHIHPDDRAFVERTFDRSAAKSRPLNVEFRVVWPDGTVRWLRDQGDIFVGARHPAVQMAGACVDITDMKDIEAALRESRDEQERRVAERTTELAQANRALTELLRRLVTVEENERRRVSRELHDGLGQEVTALMLGLNVLGGDLEVDVPTRARLVELEGIVRRIGRAAHDLAVDLRPTALDDVGLMPALTSYVARWSERTGVAVHTEFPGLNDERLPAELETTLYRVVQEALNNIAKHAHASVVSIIVDCRPERIMALIEDDGQGFELAAPSSNRRTLGLLGLRERVGLVGGTLLVESDVGQGTLVRAQIPLPLWSMGAS